MRGDSGTDKVEMVGELDRLAAQNEELRRRIAELESDGHRCGATLDSITEERAALEVLRKSEERFRQISELVSDYAYSFQVEPDGSLRGEWTTDSVTRIFGYTKTEIDARGGWASMLHPDDLPLALQHVQNVLQGEHHACEVRFVARSGEVRWIRDHAVPIWDEGRQRVIRICGAAQDITQDKLAKDELRRKEGEWESLVKNTPAVILTADREGRISFQNRALPGSAVQDAVGRSIHELTPPEYRQTVREAIQVALATGQTVDYETRVAGPDGAVAWYSTRIGAIPHDDRGTVILIATDVTGRKQAEEALRKSEAQLSNAMKMAHAGHWEYDVGRDRFTFNDNFYRIFRSTVADVGGYEMSSADYSRRFCHPDDAALVGQEVRAAIESTDPDYSRQIEHRILYADGEVGHIAVRFFVVKDAHGRTLKTYGVNQDITERKRACEIADRAAREQAAIADLLRVSASAASLAEQLGLALDALLALPWLALVPRGAVFLADGPGGGLVLRAHRNLSDVVRQSCRHVPLGKCLCGRATADKQIVFASDIDDRHEIGYAGMEPHGHYCVPILAGERLLGVLTLYVAAGHRRNVLDEAFLTAAADALAGIIERRQAYDTLARMALEDPLTGLPTRNCLIQRMTAERKPGIASCRGVAVVVALDGFKAVNESLGHDIGDLVLRHVALRLPALAGPDAIVGRMGGDAFVALLRDAADVVDPEGAARRLLSVFAQPFALPEFAIDVAATAGVAVCGDGTTDPGLLLRKAEIALYHAKARQAPVAVFAPGMERFRPEDIHLLGDLRRAIDRDELVLYYQPVVELPSRHTVGVEALVRWRHPVRGFIPPGQFIPIAEGTHLIHPLTSWVLRTAVAQAKAWHEAGRSLVVSVNLGAANLQNPALPAELELLMREQSVPPHLLKLEITETGLMADPKRARETVIRLRELGFLISIDDFGTGYSSLAYLKTLPVHEVKVDRIFVFGMVKDEKDERIVRATIGLAHSLGLEVTAEGVEDEVTLERLVALGCDRAQGFFMSKPVPAGDVKIEPEVVGGVGADAR